MKKNKGFTLVEVLAAVTILGILSVLAIVSVNRIIQNAKKEHYTTAEEQLKLAGQSYVQQNRNVLPKAIGQKKKVSLRELMNKNYIKQIKDYSDNNCSVDNSYVQVFKYSKSNYSYVAYLECPEYNSKKTIEKGSPHITMTLSNPNTVKGANANVVITDNEKLLSWSYIIYKNGKEVKNSGSTQVPGYDKRVEKDINISKYTPGKIKVVVTATNIYGLTTTKTSEIIDYKDKQKPSCVILKEEDNPTNPKPWTKGPVTITVGCNDGEGVGCKKETFTKTFKTTTNIGKIRITDKEGNTEDCQVSVNVDVTPPDVPNIGLYKWLNNTTNPTNETGLAKYNTNGWSANNIYTKATGSDKAVANDSGFDRYEYTITGSEPNKTNQNGQTASITTTGTSTIKYRACDKLGNCSKYSDPQTIKVDKIAPTCTTSGGGASWTNKDVTITGTCKDTGGSGCAEATVSKKYDKEINSTTETPGIVKDKAGNTTTCPNNQIVKIDKTDPSCTSSGGSANWTKNNLTLTGTCKDTGGSGCVSNANKEYKNDINSTKESPGTVKDNAGNTKTCPNNQTVKIDKTAPSCTSSVTSGTLGNNGWYKSKVTLKGTCSDGQGSGCKGDTTYNVNSQQTKTGVSPGTVYDNVGNSKVCPNISIGIDWTPPTMTAPVKTCLNSNGGCGGDSRMAYSHEYSTADNISGIKNPIGYNHCYDKAKSDQPALLCNGYETGGKNATKADYTSYADRNVPGAHKQNYGYKQGLTGYYQLFYRLTDNAGNTSWYRYKMKYNPSTGTSEMVFVAKK